MNILFVGAHHDDLEVSIGGSVRRWTQDGHRVFSAILTDSTWVSPTGERFRQTEQVEEYCQAAAQHLGYHQLSLNYCPAFELRFSDDKVRDVWNIIADEHIDALVTISPGDPHPDHECASRIALAAARKVPRVLLVRLSWNSTPQPLKANYFVDITQQFADKQHSLRCYKDEYARTGALWEKFIRSSAELYGLEADCELAEGFEVVKFRY